MLDELGEEVFTTAKVRKELDRLFAGQNASFLRMIRKELGDNKVAPAQIRAALARIWPSDSVPPAPLRSPTVAKRPVRHEGTPRATIDYGEKHHTDGKPAETVELYRALDRMCQEFAEGKVMRRFLAQNVAWSLGKNSFCSAHLQQNGLRVWLRVEPQSVSTILFARDVSKIGHWGNGDVELALESMERLREAEPIIRRSFEATQHGT